MLCKDSTARTHLFQSIRDARLHFWQKYIFPKTEERSEGMGLQEVRSARSIGIHCCTFSLTDEALDEPPKVLLEEAAAAGLPKGSFITLQHGALLRVADGAIVGGPMVLGE